jgi:WhiB family transcriptional regulator, redox-sensing transcriptional regulator
MSTERRHWRRWASCRDHDPELFFPTATTGPTYEAQVAAAKAVCAGCPVRAACLAEALESIPEGIAGGMTEQERRSTRRRDADRRVTSVRRLDWVRDTATAGQRLLAKGLSPRVAAARCGVSVRTAQRWAASMRREVAGGAEAAS